MRKHVSQMKDGEVARIVQWTETVNYLGSVVQRYGKHLIQVEGGKGASWGKIWTEGGCLLNQAKYPQCMVKTGTITFTPDA